MPGMRVALLALLGVGDPGMREPPAPLTPSALTGEAKSDAGFGILERPAALIHTAH